MALVILVFHFVSALRIQWQTFSTFTLTIVALILVACLVRVWLTRSRPLRNLLLHLLTVVDGILIYALIVSYGAVYGLPVDSYLRSPSVVFLAVYTGVRVLRFDPVPIIVAGATVLAGWLALFAHALG